MRLLSILGKSKKPLFINIIQHAKDADDDEVGERDVKL